MSSVHSSKETVDAENHSQNGHSDRKRVFISYSSKDEKLHRVFLKHLSLLEQSGKITIWHNQKILPGANRRNEIQESLDKADIILLLISPDFITSEYFQDSEVQKALKRSQAGKVRVIPILLRPVDWQAPQLEQLQALPRNGQPITSWQNRDEAFKEVVEEIQKILESEKSEKKIGKAIFWGKLVNLVRVLSLRYAGNLSKAWD